MSTSSATDVDVVILVRCFVQRAWLKVSLLVVTTMLLPAHVRADDPTPAAAAPAAPIAPVAAAADAAPTTPLAEADALMQSRGLAGCTRAVELYKGLLSKAPDDAMLQLKTADALNCVMRIRTDNNNVLVDALNDTEPHKKIWRDLGGEAVELAKKGYAQRPGDPWALSVYADAYMFQSSSYGILEALFKGAADTYVKNATGLIETKPLYDHGVGHILLAAFNIVAPWPVSDGSKALANAQAAAKLYPRSRRAQYYLGVVHYRQGRFVEAATALRAAVAGTCETPTERDSCDATLREARRGLALAEQKSK